MQHIKKPIAYRVDIIECQHELGCRVDESFYFDNGTEAREYVRNYNAENVDKQVSDWCKFAKYFGVE